MQEKVEEFLMNMLNMGLSRGQANEKTYEYALALQTDALPKGDTYVPAAMMVQAAELVKEAWTSKPLAYYLQELKHQMR